MSLRLYNFARDYARQRGIIIADRKFEFGLFEGELLPIDEAAHRLPSAALLGCVRVFGKSAKIFCGIRHPRGRGIRVRMEQMPGTNKRAFLNKVAKIAVE